MATKNLQYESGRSMVEMLGTLAIIGVLSVGAIAGYSYGMDKYRANQTINDVMLMGVDMITQLSQNRGIPTLSEWGTKTTVGYNFTVVANPDNETQYGIQISGVPARVCKMVGDALKPMASVYVNDDEHVTEEDPCDESDNNTMEFYFASAPTNGECEMDSDCGEGNYCDMGLCFSGHKPEVTAFITNTTCETNDDCNKDWEGNCAYCNLNLGYCAEKINTLNTPSCILPNGITGLCVAANCFPTGCTYDQNKCGDKQYCASSNKNDCTAFSENEYGSCISVNDRLSKIEIDNTTYYVSTTMMSWWDANAACKALGNNHSLLSLSELVSGWSGEKSADLPPTPLATTLNTKIFNNAHGMQIWTSDEYDSCYAYYLYPEGWLGTSSRNDIRAFAVCK